MSVRLSGNFGADWRLQKWSDLAKNWHTWSLGESLGVFFSFFQSPKTRLITLGYAGDLKNDPIWLRFCTLVTWVNPWGCFWTYLRRSYRLTDVRPSVRLLPAFLGIGSFGFIFWHKDAKWKSQKCDGAQFSKKYFSGQKCRKYRFFVIFSRFLH